MRQVALGLAFLHNPFRRSALRGPRGCQARQRAPGSRRDREAHRSGRGQGIDAWRRGHQPRRHRKVHEPPACGRAPPRRRPTTCTPWAWLRWQPLPVAIPMVSTSTRQRSAGPCWQPSWRPVLSRTLLVGPTPACCCLLWIRRPASCRRSSERRRRRRRWLRGSKGASGSGALPTIPPPTPYPEAYPPSSPDWRLQTLLLQPTSLPQRRSPGQSRLCRRKPQLSRILVAAVALIAVVTTVMLLTGNGDSFDEAGHRHPSGHRRCVRLPDVRRGIDVATHGGVGDCFVEAAAGIRIARRRRCHRGAGDRCIAPWVRRSESSTRPGPGPTSPWQGARR